MVVVSHERQRREGDRRREKRGDPHLSIQCPLHHSAIPAPKTEAQCIMHFVDTDCTCSVRNGVNRVFIQYICPCMHAFTCYSTLTKEYIREGCPFHFGVIRRRGIDVHIFAVVKVDISRASRSGFMDTSKRQKRREYVSECVCCVCV